MREGQCIVFSFNSCFVPNSLRILCSHVEKISISMIDIGKSFALYDKPIKIEIMKTRIFNLIIIDESDSMNSTACLCESVANGRLCRFDKIAQCVSSANTYFFKEYRE